MYEYFLNNYSDNLIENSKEYLIYLIPGEKLFEVFEWYGKKRAEAFKIYNFKTLINDIEERDFYFKHMLIFDKKSMDLAGGQRFLFSKKGETKNKKYSYLEEYHPRTYEKLKNESFCEIGRTFVMPNYQKKNLLKELIRGFVIIPESNNINIGLGLISFNHKHLKKECINHFLKILELSKTNCLDLPLGKYLYEYREDCKTVSEKFNLDYNCIKLIEKELKNIDKNFFMPEVLKPYLRYCGLSFESYSIAKDYNGVIQLLFSGRSEFIDDNQRKFLKRYKFD